MRISPRIHGDLIKSIKPNFCASSASGELGCTRTPGLCLAAVPRQRPSHGLRSAGVILFILLSGQPPFWGHSERAVYDSILVRNLKSL